uniref:Uncharacterized protein n=1 Tax=Buteo japonicus TaxID=224669 RepID=A0A8C0B2C6_9AVES
MAHPEVLRVHVQLLAVQLGQLGVGRLNVVQVLDGFPEGGEHFPAMGTDLGVANDGSGAGEVPEGSEEPLGPGVDDQQPEERWRGDTSRHRDINVPQSPFQTLGLAFLHGPPPAKCLLGLLLKIQEWEENKLKERKILREIFSLIISLSLFSCRLFFNGIGMNNLH